MYFKRFNWRRFFSIHIYCSTALASYRLVSLNYPMRPHEQFGREPSTRAPYASQPMTIGGFC